MESNELIPDYLRMNTELWEAWRTIQAAGEGEANGKGWEIQTVSLGDGVFRMRLDVLFTPVFACNPDETDDQ